MSSSNSLFQRGDLDWVLRLPMLTSVTLPGRSDWKPHHHYLHPPYGFSRSTWKWSHRRPISEMMSTRTRIMPVLWPQSKSLQIAGFIHGSLPHRHVRLHTCPIPSRSLTSRSWLRSHLRPTPQRSPLPDRSKDPIAAGDRGSGNPKCEWLLI